MPSPPVPQGLALNPFQRSRSPAPRYVWRLSLVSITGFCRQLRAVIITQGVRFLFSSEFLKKILLGVTSLNSVFLSETLLDRHAHELCAKNHFIGLKNARVQMISFESLPFGLQARAACSHTNTPSIKTRKASHYAFFSFNYEKKQEASCHLKPFI